MMFEMADMVRTQNELGTSFLVTELELAITFCEVGMTTADLSRAERNANNARVALETVKRIKERITLNGRGRRMISRKTSELAARLLDLERRLGSSPI